MQLGPIRLTPAQKQERLVQGLFLLQKVSTPSRSLPAKRPRPHWSREFWILEQCNLDCNFIDGNTARKWFIPAIPLPKPIIAWTLADRPLTTITHTTPLLSGNQGIELYTLESPNTTIIFRASLVITAQSSGGLV